MKKMLYLFLLFSIITLSACKQDIDPTDDNITNPQDNDETPTTNNEPTYLEDFYDAVKLKYNQFNARDIHIVYYDEDLLIFRNNVNMFYKYKNEELTEHNVIGNSTSTPGIIRYIKETSTLYYVDVSYRIYVTQNEKVLINTYNFDTSSNGAFTTVDEIHSLTHDHFITEIDNDLTVYDNKMNVIEVYEDGLYLGYTNHPNNIDEAYSLIAEKDNDVCNVDVYQDELVKTIPLNIDCNYSYSLFSGDTGIHFLLGDRYTESYLYHFDVTTQELNKINTYDSGISYVDEEVTDIYKGLYAFRLSNDTSVVYNDSFTSEQSYIYTMEDILLMGESFYVTKPENDYILNDLESNIASEVDSLFFSGSNYRTTDDYFVGTIYDGNTFLYLEYVFNSNGEEILSEVMDFYVLSNNSAIFIDNMTTNSYDVKIYSFAIEEPIQLYRHTFLTGEQGRFIEYFIDTDNYIYVTAGNNLSILKFDETCNELESYKFLGIRNYKGYRMLYLIDEDGLMKEVLIS